jgi:hypothetical protein
MKPNDPNQQFVSVLGFATALPNLQLIPIFKTYAKSRC